MNVIHRRSYRWTEEDVAAMELLSKRWGGVEPLSETGVIREALRRCAEQEKKSAKNPKKSVALS